MDKAVRAQGAHGLRKWSEKRVLISFAGAWHASGAVEGRMERYGSQAKTQEHRWLEVSGPSILRRVTDAN